MRQADLEQKQFSIADSLASLLAGKGNNTVCLFLNHKRFLFI